MNPVQRLLLLDPSKAELIFMLGAIAVIAPDSVVHAMDTLEDKRARGEDLPQID